MQTRPLGRTGIDVSALCMGTMTFGEQSTEAESHALLDRAVAGGINFIDTAEMYSIPVRAETYGRSEEIVGSWLAARGGRDKLVIATKVVGPGDRFKHIRGGSPRLDRANIEAAVDASLMRLRCDEIDLYQLHWPERSTNYFGALGYRHVDGEDVVPLEETLDALAGVVAAGKVRAVGLSNETPWGLMRCVQLAESAGLPRIASIQNPYSLLNRTFEIGLAEAAIREDCGLLAYGVLASGMLTGKYLDGQKPAGARLTRWPEYFPRYLSSGSVAATAEYAALAREHGLEPAALALAWALRQRFMTSVIIGATDAGQLDAALAAAELELADSVLKGVEAVEERQPLPYLLK